MGSIKSAKVGETGLERSREWVGSIKSEEVGKDWLSVFRGLGGFKCKLLFVPAYNIF